MTEAEEKEFAERLLATRRLRFGDQLSEMKYVVQTLLQRRARSLSAANQMIDDYRRIICRFPEEVLDA